MVINKPTSYSIADTAPAGNSFLLSGESGKPEAALSVQNRPVLPHWLLHKLRHTFASTMLPVLGLKKSAVRPRT
jgi:hypothetical protein